MKNQFNYQCIAESKQGYVHVHASGIALPSCIIKMYEDVTTRAKMKNLSKILVELTDCELDYSGSEVLRVMKKVAPLLAQFTVARVVAHACYKNELIETISAKQALPIKNFDNRDCAISWLTKQ